MGRASDVVYAALGILEMFERKMITFKTLDKTLSRSEYYHMVRRKLKKTRETETLEYKAERLLAR